LSGTYASIPTFPAAAGGNISELRYQKFQKFPAVAFKCSWEYFIYLPVLSEKEAMFRLTGTNERERERGKIMKK
jgi:hypothetical protein